jgi:hypothetical protein
MQQLRAERLIVSRSRLVEFTDMASLQTLAHYQPLDLAPIPMPPKIKPDRCTALPPASGRKRHIREETSCV